MPSDSEEQDGDETAPLLAGPSPTTGTGSDAWSPGARVCALCSVAILAALLSWVGIILDRRAAALEKAWSMCRGEVTGREGFCAPACTCHTDQHNVSGCLDVLAGCTRGVLAQRLMPAELYMVHRTQRRPGGLAHILQSFLEGVVLASHFSAVLVPCHLRLGHVTAESADELMHMFDWPRTLPAHRFLHRPRRLAVRLLLSCEPAMVVHFDDPDGLARDLDAIVGARAARRPGMPSIVALYGPRIGAVEIARYDPEAQALADAGLGPHPPRHFGHVAHRYAGLWLRDALQSRLAEGAGPGAVGGSGPPRVAVHVRRGDVSANQGTSLSRFRSDRFSLGLAVAAVETVTEGLGQGTRVEVDLHTESGFGVHNLAVWNETLRGVWDGAVLHAHTDSTTVRGALENMATADILVPTRSGLSALAGLLSCGVKLGPAWYGQLPDRHLVYDLPNATARLVRRDRAGPLEVAGDLRRFQPLLAAMWAEHRSCRGRGVAGCCRLPRALEMGTVRVAPTWPRWRAASEGV